MHMFGEQISKGAKTFLSSNCPRSALHSNPNKSKRNHHSGTTAWRKTHCYQEVNELLLKCTTGDPTRGYRQAAALPNGKKKAQRQLGCYQLADNKMCWAIHPDMRRRNSFLQCQAIMVLSGQLLEGTPCITVQGSLSLSVQHAFRKLPN